MTAKKKDCYINMDYTNPPRTALGSVINGMCYEAHRNAVEHGFYEEINERLDYLQVNDQPEKHAAASRDFVLAQIAKIAGEAGEAVSAIQHEDDSQLLEELADIVIRTFDLAEHLNGRLGDCIVMKMDANKKRPYKHGKVC